MATLNLVSPPNKKEVSLVEQTDIICDFCGESKEKGIKAQKSYLLEKFNCLGAKWIIDNYDISVSLFGNKTKYISQNRPICKYVYEQKVYDYINIHICHDCVKQLFQLISNK